jgi:hypothetical protein
MTPDSKPLPVAPRYRARFIDPGDTTSERPVQVYGNDWQQIEQWATNILMTAKSPDAIVNVFETSEHHIKLFTKPTP